MPEREGRDPIREAQKVGAALADKINADLAAMREKTIGEALRKGTTAPEIITTGIAAADAKRDTEPVASERLEKEEERRRACLKAIREKLKAQETPIDDATASILSVIMEKASGEWNEYDGDPEGVDLGRIDFDPSTQTITINFKSDGYPIGERVLTLAHT